MFLRGMPRTTRHQHLLCSSPSSTPSLSAFRSEPTAAPPPPRVERQQPGMKNPKPPSFSPPPVKSQAGDGDRGGVSEGDVKVDIVMKKKGS